MPGLLPEVMTAVLSTNNLEWIYRHKVDNGLNGAKRAVEVTFGKIALYSGRALCFLSDVKSPLKVPFNVLSVHGCAGDRVCVG